MLRYIADLSTLENSAWIPRPHPSELPRLRKLAWRVELERQAERATAKELRLHISGTSREHARERMNMEADIRFLNALRQSERGEAQSHISKASVACAKEIKRLKAKVREVNKDWQDDSTEWQARMRPTNITPAL